MHVPNEKRSQLSSKSIPFMFLGYCEGTKTYRLMCVETERIIKSQDVVFLVGTKEVDNVHDNRFPSKEVIHIVDEITIKNN
jgi:hypothetical protein